MKYLWLASLLILLIACSPVAMDKPPDPTPDMSSEITTKSGSTERIPPTQTPAAKPAQATEPVSRLRADLPDLGPAPELENEIWLNTDQPLRLADLSGKVVLIDMWTFG